MLIAKRLTRFRILSTIRITSVDNVLAVCNNDITIIAELHGSVTGHTFSWEQLNGNEVGVVYTSPTNESTLSYTNFVPPGTHDDKQFRFWVDKGTPHEQYQDVWVWGSPIELQNMNLLQTTNDLNVVDQIGPSSISAYFSIGLIYDTDGVTYYSGVFLEWGVPANQNTTKFLNYRVQVYDTVNGVWNTVYYTTDGTAALPLSNTFVNPLPNTWYRIVGEYSNLTTTQSSFIYSNNLSYQNSSEITLPILKVTDVYPMMVTNQHNVSNIISNLRTLTLQQYSIPDNDIVTTYTSQQFSNNNISNYNNLTLQQFSMPDVDVISSAVTSNTNINNTITYYNVLSNINIGG